MNSIKEKTLELAINQKNKRCNYLTADINLDHFLITITKLEN